ncbi:MAG: hypothetical protein QM687_05170 [Ferruginibacter sp.]
MRTAAILLLFVIVCCSCSPPKTDSFVVEPSFYHWKTVFSPSGMEQQVIRQNKVQNIYLRFFDVAWDASYSKPAPIAQVRVNDSSFIRENGLHIIPTVFITNECIHYIRPEQCHALAENIYQLITAIAAANHIGPVTEIQVDCDWTASTKEKYFTILSALQQIDTTHLYSATIRLFQVKYRAEAGVPPVKKGLLMCYNMGNLKSAATENSILDPEEVKKYTGNLDEYPLPLDVALPLFQWYVLFRNGGYTGLVQDLTDKELQGIAKETGKNHFTLLQDTLLRNTQFKKGDMLRLEDCSYASIMQTASVLRRKLNNHRLRLVLYHLDSITLKKYSAHEMEAVFHSLD